jgi:hypothetical protein
VAVRVVTCWQAGREWKNIGTEFIRNRVRIS